MLDYDFRTSPLCRNSSSSSTSSTISMYPRVGGQRQTHGGTAAAPPDHSVPPPSSSSPGLEIRGLMKPDGLQDDSPGWTDQPPLAPLVGDIPRSNFQFDFDFEKKVLAEAKKQSPNWSKLAAEIPPPRTSEPIPPPSIQVGDPVVGKYVASGLSREAVTVAVANYGDNLVKVREFSSGYNLLREMGFPSNIVAEALFMNENNKDKALAYLLNCSS